jgi:hypothetical protein
MGLLPEQFTMAAGISSVELVSLEAIARRYIASGFDYHSPIY